MKLARIGSIIYSSPCSSEPMPSLPEGKPEVLAKIDERVSFKKDEEKWIFEDGDEEFEYDDDLQRWVPEKRKIENDERELKEELKKEKKRKIEELKEQERNKPKSPPQTGVYITNLPSDTTLEEIEDAFGKLGTIGENLITGEKKIKLYRNEENQFKGDALVVYLKPESVDLAIEMLDGIQWRPLSKETIHVEKADFSHKESDSKAHNKDLTEEQKQVIKKRLQRLKSRSDDWKDDIQVEYERRQAEERFKHFVVLKNVFDLKTSEDDLFEIKQDIREGCEEIGSVTNVVLYDLEPEGIVSVRFSSKDDAARCAQEMNGRYFDGKKLEAFIYDGKSKYRRKEVSKEDQSDRFGTWLEG